DDVDTRGAVAEVRSTLLAVSRADFLAVAQVEQGADVSVCDEADTSASPAVAANGATGRYELFFTVGDGTGSAVSGDGVYCDAIDEAHVGSFVSGGACDVSVARALMSATSK
ncbi:MAG: hypothetical protein ACI81R_001156, partial [Bradymonadia bacterium]